METSFCSTTPYRSTCVQHQGCSFLGWRGWGGCPQKVEFYVTHNGVVITFSAFACQASIPAEMARPLTQVTSRFVDPGKGELLSPES